VTAQGAYKLGSPMLQQVASVIDVEAPLAAGHPRSGRGVNRHGVEFFDTSFATAGTCSTPRDIKGAVNEAP
jgi:hypothetical protein